MGIETRSTRTEITPAAAERLLLVITEVGGSEKMIQKLPPASIVAAKLAIAEELTKVFSVTTASHVQYSEAIDILRSQLPRQHIDVLRDAKHKVRDSIPQDQTDRAMHMAIGTGINNMFREALDMYGTTTQTYADYRRVTGKDIKGNVQVVGSHGRSTHGSRSRINSRLR